MRPRPANPHILVLSATGAGRLGIVDALRAEHYDVTLAAPGPAVDTALADQPDLVVVDGGAALRADMCSTVRRISPVPILVIGQPDGRDAADCLERGADDYLARPERQRECVARVRARLRRCPPSPDPAHCLVVGDLALDHERHEVKVSGRVVPLPLKQFQLLELLMANAGRVLPHRTIADRVWGRTAVDQNTLQAQVARLRRALGEGDAGARIRAVRGVGYTFSR